MDIRKTNEVAWDKKVASGSQWTRPVDSEIVQRAQKGQWQVILTPAKPVPSQWFPGFPKLNGLNILALASGGGQQAPVFAAAGAAVTVFDNSNAQLEQDRMVAQRDGLDLETVQGDMTDLSQFSDQSFDLIFHPVSNCFISDVQPVWQEAFRVLKPGGRLLSGFMNPDFYIFDFQKAEKHRILDVKYPLPYSDQESLDADALAKHLAEGEALEFSHTLESLIGGQTETGFQIAGFYEDHFGPEVEDLASEYIPVCFATLALRPG